MPQQVEGLAQPTHRDATDRQALHLLQLLDGDVLMTELETSQEALLTFAQDGLQQMPAKAHRWVGEMKELTGTCQAIGLTPRMLAGAAAMSRDVSQTMLGRESPEDQRKLDRSFDAFIGMLERDMPRG